MPWYKAKTGCETDCAELSDIDSDSGDSGPTERDRKAFKNTTVDEAVEKRIPGFGLIGFATSPLDGIYRAPDSPAE